MRTMLRLTLSALLALASLGQLPAQEKSVNPGINKQYEGDVNAEKYVGSFEVEGREAFGRRKAIVAAMQLKPGMTVADVGAGTGLFTRLFADAVGPQGTVYATDIQANFLEHILKTSHDAGLNNVKTVLSTADDSGLAPNSCDVVYVSDVYHHFEFPAKTMATIRKALRPGGRFVIVDYKRVEGRSTDFIYHHLRAGREVFEAEIKSFGFKLVDEPLFLRDNYMLRFEPFEVPPVPEEAKSKGSAPSLETPEWRVDLCAKGWALVDKRSGVRWPTSGWAALQGQGCASVKLADDRGSLAVRCDSAGDKQMHVFNDLLAITAADGGGIVVPCREGLWIPADGKHDFKYPFGNAEYEVCHMNMLGLLKGTSGLLVTWDDADVTPEIERGHTIDGVTLRLTTNLGLQRTAHTIRLTPLGSGDINTLAVAYRQLREKLGPVETIKQGEKSYRMLDPAAINSRAIPFWEMVYHDRQNCSGKDKYDAAHAAEFVDHHLLAARPLDYDTLPLHLPGKEPFDAKNSMEPQACFTRTDGGWAAGKHPLDAFLKNTQEVLGPLNVATANQRLERFEFLTPDGSVRRATYGQGRDMTTVVVNLGPSNASLPLDEGNVVLPQYGFSVYGPRITAFYAKTWGGIDYPKGALFAVTPRDGKPLNRASEMRIYHGFGPSNIRLRGSLYEVPGEKVVSLKQRRDIPKNL